MTFIFLILLLVADLVALITLLAAPATSCVPISNPPVMLVLAPVTADEVASLVISDLGLPGTYIPSMASREKTFF